MTLKTSATPAALVVKSDERVAFNVGDVIVTLKPTLVPGTAFGTKSREQDL
jgi:hypothetical protein